jgi:ceramide glucosyltransferase
VRRYTRVMANLCVMLGWGVKKRHGRIRTGSFLAPRAGLEPATTRLTAECSTIELPRSKAGRTSVYNGRLADANFDAEFRAPSRTAPSPSAKLNAVSLLGAWFLAGGFVTLALLTLVAGSLVYSALAIVAAFRYLAVRPAVSADHEPVSILKPLAGLDLGLESNLRTFFDQQYPTFEILFAVRTHKDPAVSIVEKLQAEYPQVPSRLLIVGEPPYPNAKVFSLDRMLAAAAHDLVVMSDSDIRVTPDMLRRVAAEFSDPKIGVATCPYRAVAGPGFWSKLEATGMNTDFWAGVLTARMLEGMEFAVGPTIVARKRALDTFGGMDRVKDYLAEDFVLGKFAAEARQGVILSSYVVQHHIAGPSPKQNSFREISAHRLRWCRSTRRSRPAGYIGQIFTMPFPLALLTAAVSPMWWPVVPIAFAVRAAAARVVSWGVLRVRLNWWLVPLEDVAGFCFWLAGFFGNNILWRGRMYHLEPDGRFRLVADRPSNR